MTLHYRALPDLTGADLRADLRAELPADLYSASLIDEGLPRPPYGSFYPRATPQGVLAAPQATPAPAAAPGRTGAYLLWGKRAIDVVLASAALVMALPVLMVLSLLLAAEGGNPFFTQTRVGRDGRVFRMFKLRTMVPGAEAKLAECLERDPAMLEEWLRTQKLRHDPRITPLGRLLRMTSLDELPQLLNVLLGDMSLVGPRPMLPEQLPLYRHPEAYVSLAPGITGLWQVTARCDESFELRAELDATYARRVHFLGDLRILFATVGAVLKATGR